MQNWPYFAKTVCLGEINSCISLDFYTHSSDDE